MDEAQPLPSELYDRVRAALASSGPVAAIEALCAELDAAGEYQALFYGLLMKKRVELGVPPFPTSPAVELPSETHEAYENAIREAGRYVGDLLIQRRDLFKAWGFYRMLGETEPVRMALESHVPGEDEDTYGLVDIAWQQGVHPRKGFDLVLERHGICSAITMVGGADLTRSPEIRDYCVQGLVRSLHSQLLERLRADLESHGGSKSTSGSIPALLAAHPDVFDGDQYHIDVSHLMSVVQFATLLPVSVEMELARELAEYGARLSPTLRGDLPPPFDQGYSDYVVLFDILLGRKADEGIAHFRAKCEAAKAEGETNAAEMLVNLLLRLERLPEALDVAKSYLSEATGELSCPNVTELARRAKDYAALSDAAKAQGDSVNWLAGLIAGKASGAA